MIKIIKNHEKKLKKSESWPRIWWKNFIKNKWKLIKDEKKTLKIIEKLSKNIQKYVKNAENWPKIARECWEINEN